MPRLDTLPVHRQLDYCLHPLHHIVGFTEPCLRGLLARVGLEVVASFYELVGASKKGLPTHLRVVARKTAKAPVLEPDPASALKPLIEFLTTQRRNRDDVGVNPTFPHQYAGGSPATR